MGKDSEFYKDKNKKQLIKYRDLLSQLPALAQDYLYSKEHTAQISTLISYAYDLLTFFRFLQKQNPVIAKTPIIKIDYELLNKVTFRDIEEYMRYLTLNLDHEVHTNGPKAIARKMSPLRGMFKYHYIRKNIVDDPTVLVELPRLKKDKNISQNN